MPLRTIETVVDIAEDRRLIVQLPNDVPVGKHRVVAVLDEATVATNGKQESWKFPVLEGIQWPPGLILRREDLYGE
jgi:hypothetical protein